MAIWAKLAKILAMEATDLLSRQLLMQLGERLRALRQSLGVTAVAMAEQLGVSRTTLRAVESGDPSPSIGVYVQLMGVLGISHELALLAGDLFSAAPKTSAASRAKRSAPSIRLEISPDPEQHRMQDLQSLALHSAAVQLLKKEPQRIELAFDVLQQWIRTQPASRSMPLWREWQGVLERKAWRRVLAQTASAQQLRQASPLGAVLPQDLRREVLGQAASAKQRQMFVGGVAKLLE